MFLSRRHLLRVRTTPLHSNQRRQQAPFSDELSLREEFSLPSFAAGAERRA